MRHGFASGSAWIGSQTCRVVAQVGSLGEARRQAASVGCDVEVLDLGLPDGNGADLIAELREVCPGLAVLILNASLGAANLTRAEEVGADEVLDMFVDLTEIIGAIMRLGNG
jgi:DNA-binding NarL/FixJ family response regulator